MKYPLNIYNSIIYNTYKYSSTMTGLPSHTTQKSMRGLPSHTTQKLNKYLYIVLYMYIIILYQIFKNLFIKLTLFVT